MKLIKPYIQYQDIESQFKEVFESGIFTRGKYVDQFKQDIREYTGSSYCHLATSATTALWLVLKILGIKQGDEVIVSDFSFPATANVVEDLGAVPVFADVSKETYNMLPSELKRRINEKTKAVIFVDALGNPSGVTEIQKICSQYGLPLIEDAACAIGSHEFGVPCGNISDITCFSFHPRKLISTGEGGAITTKCGHLYKKMETKLSHGANGFDGPSMNFVTYGYNFRMSELQAVMGSSQIRKIDEITLGRNTIRDEFVAGLSPLGFVNQAVSADAFHNIQSLVFTVPAGIDRNGLIQALKGKGIESTLGTYSMSAIAYYKNKYNDVQPNGEYLFNNTITLPCYDGVDINQVVTAIKACLTAPSKK
jgi:perosamine synthetase